MIERPDQHTAHVLPLEAHDELAVFSTDLCYRLINLRPSPASRVTTASRSPEGNDLYRSPSRSVKLMPLSPLSQASGLPGNLLRRHHQASVAIFLRKCEAYQLAQLHYILLSALEEMGPSDQTTLGGYTALDRNTVAVVVRKLEERGLVTLQRNHKDHRSMQVTLTKDGARLHHDVEPAIAEVQEEILAPLSANCRETLCSLLHTLANENNHLSRVPVRHGG
jgi:DNA-binding MarR family transcriptional regulator